MFPVFDVVEMTGSLGSRIALVHSHLKALPQCAAICRVSLALHDGVSGMVRTLAFSNNASLNVKSMAIPLRQVPSLVQLAKARSYRRVDDVVDVYDGARDHSAELIKSGIRSSLTFPIRHEELLVGFLFANSSEPEYFTPERVDALAPYVTILSLMLIEESRRLKKLGVGMVAV
ncbi:hypothetical protein CCC_01270 [Paramagnetospirillum magnetotacticum MS-1]|uniref:GAF domain-containing protein n=1 Tax=Paramagnetospirillum magnetotacticum MS-1 TaxID=272627 RepID=A0A0C2YES2_PARME|nr:GAF domain-containing protein [Paramagnetospirillum magnetotacticum]KIL98209.1 hypothetical protein CCC_01270 [Paramagnetospirillum magnetotacticum MS-1]